jgi:integrase
MLPATIPAAIPAPYSPQALVELQRLADHAEEYSESAQSPATRRAYATDLRDVEAWCSRQGAEAYPLRPSVARLYLTHLAEGGKSLATIEGRRSAIIGEHRRRELPHPFGAPEVERFWKGLRNRLGTAPKGAKDALLVEDLRRIVDPLGERVVDLRDRALLVVGWASACRRSELVAFDVADVRFVKEGIELSVRRSKTDQEGAGCVIGVPFGSRIETCPVRALRAWLDAAGITEGPLFRKVERNGRASARRLCAAAVATIVKRHVASADGLDPDRFAGHSLRAGFCTSADEAGASQTAIMRQTRHKSPATLQRYLRLRNLWRGNAASQVGL